MPIPDFETIMLPLLKLSADGKEHSTGETYDKLATHFQLSEEERQVLVPTGKRPLFHDRAYWARTYLKSAGLLSSSSRGMFQITQSGLGLLSENPEKITRRMLERYDSFKSFKRGENARKPRMKNEILESTTPTESIDSSYFQMREDLATELLNKVKGCSPAFFERLVVELLVKMGYGGSIEDAGKVIGKSGDGGIDGLIKEDRLGLDVIYLQAKRWDGVVGRPEIQKFAGALQGKRAKKGVFITTSTFSKEALDFVSNIDSKIVLIDGEQLAELMIDHDLGVSKVISYDIKRLDSDYFSDE